VFDVSPEEVITLKKGAATEGRFCQLAPECYHVHLATHGFFAPPERKSAFSPEVASTAERQGRGVLYGGHERSLEGYSPLLLSGLAFAGANRRPQAECEDGILTAEEIAFLPLEGVKLVTLSACETGLGEVAGGEGLLGVQRVLQVAGADSVVASYWKVDDAVSRRLMERFYRNLWESQLSLLDALREAQLWVLRHPEEVRGLVPVDEEGKPLTSHERTSPYYWAAFALSGDWR